MDVFVELRALIGDFQAKMATARGEMTATAKHGSSAFGGLSALGKGAFLGIAAGAVGVAVVSTKMAGDFQQSMSKLVTSGGEMQKNLSADMSGVIRLMGQTGTSSQQLAQGLYVINSAGFHGAQGLQVLKAAAQGAKTENADLGQVTDGLTTLMNDYSLKSSQAALVTSKMVEATSLGKTSFQDLAGSLHTVAPAAHAVGLSMNEVLGAMATMTAKGTPAADAATYLRQTILQLSNPSQKAASEMSALGLSSIDVSKNLGARGLTGTLDLLTAAIEKKMGPQGTVLIDKLKKSAASTTDFQKVLANLPPVQQTFVGALANMVGGTKSMQAALELTGSTAGLFKENVRKVGAAATEAGGNVAGWAIVQKNFNQKLAEAKGSVEGLLIVLGTKLIPIIESVAKTTSTVVLWFEKHREATKMLAIAIASALVPAVIAYAIAVAPAVIATVTMLAPILAVMAAAAALGAGIYVLATHWTQAWTDIKHWFDDAVKFLRSGFGTLTLLILGPLAPLAFVALHWQEIWSGMVHFFGQALAMILRGFMAVADGALSMVEVVLEGASHLPFVGHSFALALKQVKDFQSGMDSTLQGVASDMSNWGTTAGAGFANGLAAGILSRAAAAEQAGAAIAANTAKAAFAAAQVHSPSRVMMDLGAMMAKGLELGIANNADGPAHAMAATTRRVAGAVAGGTVAGGLTAAGTAARPVGERELVLMVDGQRLGKVVLSALLQEQRSRPLGIKAA